MIKERQVKEIDPDWDTQVLSLFTRKQYEDALPAAMAYYEEARLSPEKSGQFTPKNWANILHTIAASAYGILDGKCIPPVCIHNDMDCHDIFFRYFDLYINELLKTPELQTNPDKSGLYSAYPENLLEDALKILVRFTPERIGEARQWTDAMRHAWSRELVLKVLRKTLFDVRMESDYRLIMPCIQSLASLYLEIAGENPDQYKSERSAMLNMLADMVYFFHGHGQNTEQQARELLRQSLELCPDDQFALRRREDIIRRQMIDEQIRRFDHDVNNSLGGLFSTFEKLREYLENQPADLALTATGYVQDIENGLRHIMGIHRFVQDRQPDYRVGKIMDIMVPLKASFSTVPITVCGETEVSLEMDESYVRLALNNLLNNALEAFIRNAIPEDKRAVTLRIESTPTAVHLHLVDNAGGIDPAIRQDIFSKYVSSKGIQRETGLGLYNAREAIKRMEGTLEMAPEQPESGAHFIITLQK